MGVISFRWEADFRTLCKKPYWANEAIQNSCKHAQSTIISLTICAIEKPENTEPEMPIMRATREVATVRNFIPSLFLSLAPRVFQPALPLVRPFHQSGTKAA